MYNRHNNAPYPPNGAGPTPSNPQEYTYIRGIGFSPLLTVMREKRALRRCANALGIILIAYLVLSYTIPNLLAIVISMLFSPIYGFYLPDSVYEVITMVSTILAMGLPFLCYAFVIRIPPKRAAPLRAPDFSIVIPAIFISFGASIVASFGSNLIQYALSYLGLYAPGNIGELPTSTQTATVLYLINSILVPAIFEELVFRGVMMQSLRRFGDSFAIVVSAILFGAAHGNIAVFPVALTVGLCMGYFVIRTGSLWTSMLIHFLYNGSSILLNELFTRFSEDAAMLLNNGIVIGELLLALLSLVYLVYTRPDIFTLKPAQTALSESKKFKSFFTSGAIIAALAIYALLAFTNLYAQ